MRDSKNDYEPHPHEAWSWPYSKIPSPESQEERNGVTYFYFHDDRGDLYYQTDRGMRFAEEMEAAQKKHRRKRKALRWEPQRR